MTGSSAMVGRLGVTRSPLQPDGQVLIDGELWRAVVTAVQWLLHH